MNKNSLPPIHTQTDYLNSELTDVIDVRSPGEFNEDHIPGAINLPVLNDQQRIEVGTLYKDDPFAAKKMGAAYVSDNIAMHIRNSLDTKNPDFHPLVYCWRGGQRSRSMAITLNQIGWHVSLLDGGYKNYRKHVRDILQNSLDQYQLKLINGLTGTAKTELLHHLRALDEQVLDLEGLANHKGSLLGSDPQQPQPSQKLFETRIASVLQQYNSKQHIWVESESNKIGNLHIPEILWKLMKSAPQIEIEAPIEARVKHILTGYQHLIDDPDLLTRKLSYIKDRISGEIYNQWLVFIDQGEWSMLVESLLINHYDPSYRRSMSNNQRSLLSTNRVTRLNDKSLADLAIKVTRS